jgi:hypothetical protein
MAALGATPLADLAGRQLVDQSRGFLTREHVLLLDDAEVGVLRYDGTEVARYRAPAFSDAWLEHNGGERFSVRIRAGLNCASGERMVGPTRHVQEHAGELADRAGIEPCRVGMG